MVFAGGGVHALIDGDLIGGTYLEGFPTNDWLGLYPYAQTIVAQVVAAAIVIGLFVIGGRVRRPLNCVSNAPTTMREETAS